MVALSNVVNPLSSQQMNRPEQAKSTGLATGLTWEQVVELLNKDFPGTSRLIALEFLRRVEADPSIQPISLGLPKGLEAFFALLKLGDFAVTQYKNRVAHKSAENQEQPVIAENIRFSEVQPQEPASSVRSKAA